MHLALQAADGAHHSHIAVDSFVYDIFDYQADLFCDVVVGTDELIYLVQLSVSLRQIQTAALQDSVVLFVGHSLEVVLPLSEELQNDLVWGVCPPFRFDQEPVLSWL